MKPSNTELGPDALLHERYGDEGFASFKMSCAAALTDGGRVVCVLTSFCNVLIHILCFNL